MGSSNVVFIVFSTFYTRKWTDLRLSDPSNTTCDLQNYNVYFLA